MNITGSSPVALGGINHRQSVLSLDAELVLSRLQIPLKCVHTANVEPHILLKETKNQTESPASLHVCSLTDCSIKLTHLLPAATGVRR